MQTNDFDEKNTVVVKESPNSHKTAITVLAVGLAVALAGDGYLLVRANHLNDDLARTAKRHPDADLQAERRHHYVAGAGTATPPGPGSGNEAAGERRE